MIKTLTAGALLLMCGEIRAQVFPSDASVVSGYFRKQLESIQVKTCAAVQTGKVRAYRNDSLASFYTAEDVKSLFIHTEIMQVSDSRYPDDPYMVIDTVFERPLDPVKDFCNLSFFYENEYDEEEFETEIQLQSVGVMREYRIGELILPQSYVFVVRWDDLKPLLNPEERAVLYSFFNFSLRLPEEGPFYQPVETDSVKKFLWGDATVSVSLAPPNHPDLNPVSYWELFDHMGPKGHCYGNRFYSDWMGDILTQGFPANHSDPRTHPSLKLHEQPGDAGISAKDFEKKYGQNIPVKMQDNRYPDDPTQLIDTFIFDWPDYTHAAMTGITRKNGAVWLQMTCPPVTEGGEPAVYYVSAEIFKSERLEWHYRWYGYFADYLSKR